MTGLAGARLTSLVLAAGMLTLGCGGNGGTPPTTINIAKISGDGQSATVGQPLTNPLQVEVTDGDAPSTGTTVTWSTTSPGGSLAPSSGPTGADGRTSTAWTLGTASGAQLATARLSGGSLVTFTATAAADAATTVIKAGGDEQVGEIGSQLASPVQARVTDQHGNGVQGLAVGWSATGATPSSLSVPSNAAGLSSVNVTVDGPVGPIVITATAGTLTGSPLTFNATAVVTAQPPTSINVSVRNNNFLSVRNGTSNPAVDTVLAGGTVTWTWVPTAIAHDVSSAGSPSFTSSATTPAPATHEFTFASPGTYRYYCSVHAGPASTAGMVGRIVVR